MKKLLLTAAILSSFIACKKDDKKPSGDKTPTPNSEVNLSNLQAGQQTKYTQYKGSCNTQDDEFNFTKDTITLTVINVDNQLYFEEQLTKGSPSRINGSSPGGPIRHKVYQREDYILIPERGESFLFFFYGNDTIHLKPQNRVPLHQDNCILAHDNSNPFIGNDVGLLDNYTYGPLSFSNKTAISCVPAMFGLDAYLIYDEGKLYASHTLTQEVWGLPGRQVNGWVAIN